MNFIVLGAVAGSDVSARAASLGVTATGSKLIGAGLAMFYIVFAVSLIGVVFSEINKALK